MPLRKVIMDEWVRLKAQRALRCAASALAQDDPKAYARKLGWTSDELRKLVDAMYETPLSTDERLGE